MSSSTKVGSSSHQITGFRFAIRRRRCLNSLTLNGYGINFINKAAVQLVLFAKENNFKKTRVVRDITCKNARIQ